MALVRGAVRLVGGKRGADVVDSIREVARVHDTHRESEQVGTLVGQAMVIEANKRKGLVRKAAQLMGDRKDLVGDAAICKELRGLQSECEPRKEEAIKTQMLVLNRRLELVDVLKCGTVAEVSKVSDSDGMTFALKTVNPESKELFIEDLQIFDGRFFSWLKMFLDNMPRSLSSDTIMEIKASIDNLFASVANEEFRRHLMDEFDLRTEKQNLDDARMALQRTAPVYRRALVEIAVPITYDVSADGTVLLTQWVEGPNITDYIRSLSTPPAAQVQRDLLYILARYYFNDILVRKRLHMDLHPGNMIIQDQPGSSNALSNTLRVCVLDMGDELKPTDEQARHMGQLLRFIHLEDRSGLEKCERLCRNLGVDSSRPGREQFSCFINSLDLVGGTEGLNWQENAKHTQFVTMPEHVMLWSKATSALTMTFQTLRSAFPELQNRSAVQEVVRGALSEVLDVSGYERPSQSLVQRGRTASRSRSPRSSRS